MKNVIPAVLLATTGAVSVAHSQIISIGTALNGGAITLQASGATPGPVSWSGGVGAYNINVVDAVDLTTSSFNSNAQDATSTGTKDVLDVYVSVSDASGVTGLRTGLSGLTVNFLTPGWTVTESTYEDNSNTVFGTMNLLSTHTFTSGPAALASLAMVNITSPFSVTELYQISSNGLSGAANDTIDLSAATVPEPSTWAMMLLGFAGLGFTAFRKSRRAASIAF
ncbi:MAG TPA: PEPxxWA-CTERM sorting domain-containing protein [Roseiarcus sp.]|nr:PEPxxWA-CTERM sorting domain-containing protein [Roseiarcus sp.]